MDLSSLNTRIDNTIFKNLRIGFIWASKISLITIMLITVVIWIDFFNTKNNNLLLTTVGFSIQALLFALGWLFFAHNKTLQHYKIVSSSYALLFGLTWGGAIINLNNLGHAYVIVEIVGNLLFLVVLLSFYAYRTAVYLATIPILIFTTWYSIEDPRFDLLFAFTKLAITIIIIESGRQLLFKWFTARIKQEHDNKRLLKQLAKISFTDQLTQINNRRFFDFAINKQIINAKHYHHPLSIILIDIDYFKLFNDNLGHVKGDMCLKSVATTISSSLLRNTDTVSRYGGEEFVVLLPNTDNQGARCVAHRIQQNVAGLAITHPSSDISQTVTVSQGIATLKANQLPSQLIDVADSYLYKAKELGRNQYYGT
ncbi:GGDEF domain-containing protein [Photobacterium kishitanii]|uniref:GGDEF domain-containing protein n=1 Tax=Photobacterium kishitanii TaxID=318456 RepID=UPI000436C8AF|nr:GGDEF domain-containing protein [Photobacterium kishitanii]PSV23202.1 GGDEF domain-containing protein [Photobacterium kishitanii]CEO41223.1 Diguanylate cyclase domain protein [Photobacterium kishitanii]